MEKCTISAVLVASMVVLVAAQRCPQQEPCVITGGEGCQSCDEGPQPPANCEELGGTIQQSGCNCCDTCIVIRNNNEWCGLNETSQVLYQCRCNFTCVDGWCQPENKPVE